MKVMKLTFNLYDDDDDGGVVGGGAESDLYFKI